MKPEKVLLLILLCALLGFLAFYWQLNKRVLRSVKSRSSHYQVAPSSSWYAKHQAGILHRALRTTPKRESL